MKLSVPDSKTLAAPAAPARERGDRGFGVLIYVRIRIAADDILLSAPNIASDAA